jgi:cytochrome b561
VLITDKSMTAPEARVRYSATAQLFHWVTAILVVVAFVYGPGGSEQRVYSAAKDFDRQLHETLGMSVLLLTALRLAWRTFDPPPRKPPMPGWMRRAARIGHGLLFLLLLAVPLTAITGAWLEGHPLTLLAAVRISPLLPGAHAAGSVIAEIHTWLGDTILWLAGLHAAIALLHHFVLRDRVLRSMLPG